MKGSHLIWHTESCARGDRAQTQYASFHNEDSICQRISALLHAGNHSVQSIVFFLLGLCGFFSPELVSSSFSCDFSYSTIGDKVARIWTRKKISPCNQTTVISTTSKGVVMTLHLLRAPTQRGCQETARAIIAEMFAYS